MKSILKFILLCTVAATFFVACNDILEPEIKGEKVVILAPTDSAVIVGNEVGFAWELVKGATQYHIQVAQPSFAAARKVVLDTVVLDTLGGRSGTVLAYLDHASYEWRVRAENFAYTTEYTYSSFKVDSSEQIEDYSLVLNAPANSLRTRNTTVSFSWEPLDAADFYVFRLQGADTVISQNTTQTSLEVDFTGIQEQQTYPISWNVMAVDEEDGNTTSADRSLVIDREYPAVPAAVQPEDAASFPAGTHITFEWAEVVDEDFEKYILSIYNEEDPEVPVYSEEFLNTSIELLGPVENQAFESGNYSWRVQTVDQLGNISPVGTRLGSFTINEEQ